MRRAMAGPRAAAAALQRLRSVPAFPPCARRAAVLPQLFSATAARRHRATLVASAASAAAPPSSTAGGTVGGFATEHQQTSTSTIYDNPALYDDAFGYRSFRSEAAFLLDAYRAYSGSSGGGGGGGGGGKAPLPSSVLDLGCGPGSHAVEMALVLPALACVVALDASPAMLRYARKKAAAAGARVGGAAPGPGARGAALEFVQGDMTDYSLPAGGGDDAGLRKFDLATCLLGTLSHALTNDAAGATLKRAAAHLRPGGLLVLELAHPGDLFDGTLLLGEGQPEMWEVPRNHSAAAAATAAGPASSSAAAAAKKTGFGGAAAAAPAPKKASGGGGGKRAAGGGGALPPENLLVEWGAAGDDFDPLTQVLQRTVTITALLPEGGGPAARAAAERARDEEPATAAATTAAAGASDDGSPIPPLPGQPDGEDDPFAGRRGEVVARQVVACRQFTAQEVGLLASAAGLELAAVHGEMRMDVPSLSHEDAYRMVAVMRKPVAAAGGAATAAGT